LLMASAKAYLYCEYCARRTQHRALSFIGGVPSPVCKECHTKRQQEIISPHRAEMPPEEEETGED
jgi:hypothetical protein